MPVRSVYSSRTIHDIVGKSHQVQVTDARTGAVTTKLGYQAPRVEAMGALESGFLLPLTGSGASSSSGPQPLPSLPCAS